MTVHTADQTRRLLDDLDGALTLRTLGESGMTLDAPGAHVVLLSPSQGSVVVLTGEGHTAWTNGTDVVDLDEHDVPAALWLDDDGQGSAALVAHLIVRAGLAEDPAAVEFVGDMTYGTDAVTRAAIDAARCTFTHHLRDDLRCALTAGHHHAGTEHSLTA